MTNHMRTYAVKVDGDITPEALLQLSDHAIAALEPQDVGTPNWRNYDLRRRSELALRIAEHLMDRGITTAKHAGPFSTEIFDDGQTVRIKAGSVRFSTHPQVGRDGEKVPRDFSIRIWHAYSGHIADHRDHEIVNPTIHWVGRGGYYFWTDAANVEAVAN